MWQLDYIIKKPFVADVKTPRTELLTAMLLLVIASCMGSLFHSQSNVVGGSSMGKYRNIKTTVDGITFDSAKEAHRWAELKLLERAGKIYNLQRQVPFVLIPKQVRDGKVIERPVVYKADFVYTENGEDIVEDTKSEATKTKEYIIKRKLLLWQFGIRIKEV